jgi:hypothetical protein
VPLVVVSGAEDARRAALPSHAAEMCFGAACTPWGRPVNLAGVIRLGWA